MAKAVSSRILLCADTVSAAEDVRHLLERGGHVVGRHVWANGDPVDLSACALVVLDTSGGDTEAIRCCRQLVRSTQLVVPVLVILGDHSPAARLASLEAGADAYLLRPFAPGELLAQVQALLCTRDLHARLAGKSAEVQALTQRLQHAYQQTEQDLQAARRIQRRLLPPSLPSLPQTRWAVHYRPCGRTGGDCYDVFRLDENHVGFYLADVMGHGMGAGLLSLMLQRSVRAKEINGGDYRLVPPDEVLRRLNDDLIEQALAENPFIAMVYLLYDVRDGWLHFARAGHPSPLYVPAGGEPELWHVPGTLLGVFETEFPVQSRQVRPGDKIVLCSDGLQPPEPESSPAGSAALLSCAAQHRALPIQGFVERLAQDLAARTSREDDLTLLGMERTG